MIAIIGLPGSGKTYTIKLLEKMGYSILIADDFFREQYKYGNEGYLLIKNNLGNEFVNEKSVDRNALRNFAIENMDKIEELVHPILEEHLKKNKYDFVELPIINSKYADFKKYFGVVINITPAGKYSTFMDKDFKNIILSKQVLKNKLTTIEILSGQTNQIIKYLK